MGRIRDVEADPRVRRNSPTSAPGLADRIALLRTPRDVLPYWLYYGTGSSHEPHHGRAQIGRHVAACSHWLVLLRFVAAVCTRCCGVMVLCCIIITLCVAVCLDGQLLVRGEMLVSQRCKGAHQPKCRYCYYETER